MSTFYMPVKVFAEKEAVRNHAGDMKGFGSKALLVTGRRSAVKNGSLDDVTAALAEIGCSYALFDEVEENPSIETVMKARDFGLAEKVDFVIGIGGGSPLDAAKAIALMINKPDKDISYLYNPDGDSATLPIVAVPTTCGTGSEVTAMSVLTNTPQNMKKSIPHLIFPDLALIDGKYLKAAPFHVIANTCFDALTHLLESDLNTKSTFFSHMCVDAGLRAWALGLPVLRGEKEADDKDRENMMLASMMAGMAIAHTGTSLPHGLSYFLTTRLQVPHGKATAYFATGYMAETNGADRDYVLQTAGFSDLEDYLAVYRKACGRVDAAEERLREVLTEGMESILDTPARLALAPFKADSESLRRIVFFDLEH